MKKIIKFFLAFSLFFISCNKNNSNVLNIKSKSSRKTFIKKNNYNYKSFNLKSKKGTLAKLLKYVFLPSILIQKTYAATCSSCITDSTVIPPPSGRASSC